ncbi:oligosaccharide flippase family protein [Glaciihabitans sp. dw_435]|uniref:oligosaccharide flippase family protein n=1 Tax=Glaciihabitans sp. dw_435 TaxID=2720081 RepID=UPI001BD4DD80|nr:oligosaccharide flippase family protein [Glaciihabitans sp. dw_435]
MTLPSVRPALGTQVRSGLLWSSLNNIVLRLGSLALGIVLARLLTPQEFGAYAVALSVQAVLMTLADFGLSADLVRSPDFARRAPTVATLGLVTGGILTAAMALTAAPIAGLLGSPESTPVLLVLSVTMMLGSAGVVPFASLLRRFDQRRLFVIAVADFVVSTSVTVVLLLAGWGVVSLAIARVVAQTVTLILQFTLSGERPRFGLDRSLAASVLRFGLPVAGANLLSWAVLGVDKLVVAAMVDPIALGFYVLAFNVSTWPMTAAGQVLRSVALPAFARTSGAARSHALASAFALTWAVSLPLGGLLAVLASPLVSALYGDRWAPAATALAALGLLGAVRVVFELFVAYLLVEGASGRVLVVQGVWLAALVVALIPAIAIWGFVGAAWAHVAVALVVVAPAYLIALRKVGFDPRSLVRGVWPPLVAAIPAGVAAYGFSHLMTNPWAALACGGTAGALVYAGGLRRWAQRRITELTAPALAGEERMS